MVAHGMDARKALKRAKALGCDVYPVHRTGEIAIASPQGDSVRMHAGRDTATRPLVILIRRLERN